MAGSGYRYQSIDEAASDDRWDGNQLSPLEAATAKADMACKRKVDYLRVAVAVQSDYEGRVIRKRKVELATLRSNIEKWVDNASEVLRG